VRGEPVSTATDIYSLGAVLYELLAGCPAHQFKNRSTTEIERVICQEEPVRPSAIARDLPADLDNIVSMAMRKEPSRRYQSVEQLSDDVRRFLEQLPIVARKVTPLYRAAKFVRRNRWPVIAAVFVAVSLAAGIILATVQARRAERRYQQIRGFARSIIFEVNEEFGRNPTSIRAGRCWSKPHSTTSTSWPRKPAAISRSNGNARKVTKLSREFRLIDVCPT
jgi:serine/threonine protein kinase